MLKITTGFNRQSGATLVELMVSVTIGLFLLSGLLAFVVNNLEGNARIVKATKLNSSMRTLMTFMADDIRRAGTWNNAIVRIGSFDVNPFEAVTPLGINPCILYRYDRDLDGALGTTAANDERYGFILDNGTVKMRGGSGTYTCTASAEWVAVTDPKDIRITALTFYVAQNNPPITLRHSVQARDVHITLSGQLTSDPTVQQTLSQMVRIPNDGITYSTFTPRDGGVYTP